MASAVHHGRARPTDAVVGHQRTVEADRFDLSRWLPDEVRDAFVAATHRRQFPAGATIYMQDDVGNEMYRIVSGVVRLSTIREDGREFTYSLFGRPASFGFSTLIDRKGLPHTAVAQSDVEVQVLSIAAFTKLRKRFDSFNEALLQALCGHMRTLSILMGDASIEDLPRRVARRLVDLVPLHAELFDAEIKLSQSEFAAMLGVSRQSMNRLLKQMEEAGLLSVSYGSIVLHDIAALRARSSY